MLTAASGMPYLQIAAASRSLLPVHTAVPVPKPNSNPKTKCTAASLRKELDERDNMKWKEVHDDCR